MFPLSKPQRLIYDMEQYTGGAIAVICGSALFPGDIMPDKLTAAIQEIYRLNEVLRICIRDVDGQPYQEAIPYEEKAIHILRFDSEEQLHAYADQYAKEPLSLYGSLCEIQAVFVPGRYGILVKCHHMVGDAWTLTLMVSQLAAILAGETPPAFPYSDYIESEAAYSQSCRQEKDRAFFLEQFQRCPEATYLSEKPGDSFAAKRSTFHISAQHTALIRTYAKEHNTSPFVLFLTALSFYFSRVKDNAEAFYIGTPILNRGSFREKHTMGMFINTVPVLAQVDYIRSVAEHLAAMQGEVLSVLRHQKFHYNDILSAVRQEYGFTEKLYDVVLSYQNAAVTGAEQGVETTWYHSGGQTESLQVHIDDRDGEGAFRVHLDYRTDKFSDREIERMYSHILNLLLDAISSDAKKPGELALFSAAEKQQLLVDFNDTAVDYPRDKCVHTLFEEQVKKTPDKTAVIACDRTLTYRELNEEANRIAHGLIEKGVQPGDIVAFALPRNSHLIPTMFGILKTGAAYLPIDPDYPQERIAYMLEDSQAKVFVTGEELPCLLENGNANDPSLPLSSKNLCYCIYTSGSTGMPKGTLLHHQGIVNLVINLNLYSDLSRCNRFGFTTTITFDVATQEILTALLNGFTGVLLPERRETPLNEIVNAIQKCAIDIIYATPTYFDSLTSEMARAQKLFSVLKVVCLAGEKFALNSNALLLKNSTNVVFENQYGPVELHVIATAAKQQGKDFDSIGKPVKNNSAYIVDKYLNPVPIGVTGELCIAGDGVGAGYLNRPKLTAEKFIDNPFGPGKLYKTGDLAYWREDGNIVYVGRNDFLVKIRGLRIELGEIESAIAGVEGISQAVVVVRKDETGRQLICAFYTETSPVALDTIKAAIREKLPRHMMPHIFTKLDILPLTPSGKADRKALPEVDLSAIASEVEYVAPSTQAEMALAAAVVQVLGLEQVGMLDNFFDLGGDSLKAIELTAALERIGCHVEVKTIFEAETLGELAAQLTTAQVEAEPTILQGDIPAAPAQMRVYTAQSMSGGTAYNVPYAFRVKELDPARLQTAVDKLVTRHEILRTRFENRDGVIMQVVDDTARCVVEKLSSDDLLAFIRPFDLETTPLLRVGYYENTVLLDMHHIITDGGAMPVFLRELNELYMGRELNTQPVQYREFAARGQGSPEDEAYWLGVFSDEAPILELNTDYPRQGKQSYEGAAVYESISAELHAQICKKCKALGVTPYTYYLEAFQILLSKFSGSEDIVVGTPASGRSGKFLNTLGMFVNTLALRGKPEGEKTVRDFLLEIKSASVDALAHQGYPYGELVKKLGIHAEGRNPLFDVMFAYQSEEMSDVVFGDEPAELLPIPVTTSKYDFTFNLMPRNEDVVLMVEYCTELFKETTIRRFMEGYKLLLSQMLDTGRKLKELSAMSETERHTLIADFNNTAADYPREKCVHTLFEEQVERTPDKAAVIACDRTLSYRELNEEANRIAHGLIEKGVQLGNIVAFALPRNSHLIPTMLGILKAGAAYLPIDPDYPQVRIAYMLEDSAASFFVTSEELPGLLENGNANNPNLPLSSKNLCYCIYTSGSTGKPKGTLLTHKNTTNYIFGFGTLHAVANCKQILSVSSVSFDIFVTESLYPLLAGLEILLANKEQTQHPAMLAGLLRCHSADMIQAPPTKIKALFLNDEVITNASGLKAIVCGGETPAQSFVVELQEAVPAKILNVYGPTETTVGATAFEVKDKTDISIGCPLPNTQVYIVDKYGDPVPIGITGELCIAGDGVGAGYLNRPELTAEKFIDNPFGPGKLYKTGDLAYWREDGNIVYVGRNDFQVKIRGLRIELGEIENAIAGVEGVSQAVVVVRKDETGRQLICAFYTETTPVDLDTIKAAIRERLPRYMMPHIFAKLDTLPLTPSGKVDRKHLPEVDLTACQNDAEYVPPQGPIEKALAAIMEGVLGYSPVGREDNFFDLGGDSLKAIEFVSKAHTEGIYFALQNVFDYPTVGALREYIESGDKSAVSYLDVDFTAVNAALAKNRLEIKHIPGKTEVGDLLLTGATGFLGIHLLADYLDNDGGTAYCLVRGQDQADSEARCGKLLNFYFGNKYIHLLGRRIQVLCGDLQKDRLGLTEPDYQALLKRVATVINAAASVKHYGSYQYFYDVNVETTGRLVDFCKQSNARLIHISTTSVSGNGNMDVFDGYISDTEKHFYEDSLYIGQPLENVYARSKFEAEKLVLEAVSEGLPACIMRMGNLTNRASDGVFQINHETNAAAQRVKGIIELGLVPDYLIEAGMYVEFTPIDEAAQAIMLLARHFDPARTVFHINSTKVVYLDKLLELFTILGYPVRAVPGKEFASALRETAKQAGLEHIFETFINDLDEQDRLNYDSNIRIENAFTEEYLQKLGFIWGEIGLEYLRKYVEYFKKIGYWKGD